MARIRTIKPEFWTDEHVVELSAWARLLFIGLWNFADDDGRMAYSPKRIKMQIFPADDVDISALFGELRREGRITVYVVDGVEYLIITNFARHQKVDKRSASKLPAPPNSPDLPRTPPTEGIKESIKEGDQGREGNGIAPPAQKNFNRVFKEGLPSDWELPDEWRAYAAAEHPSLDPDDQAARFRDWQWKNDIQSSDWEASWRVWLRRGVELGQVRAHAAADDRVTPDQEARMSANIAALVAGKQTFKQFQDATGIKVHDATPEQIQDFIQRKAA